jgi:hypothetical protein
VYASAGGTVIKLNDAGVPFQTNAICPRPGLAQRDVDGNYYFAGILPSHLPPGSVVYVFDPQDFGGVVLSNLAVYLAKYSPAGSLLWATNFGPTSARSIEVRDFRLDESGNAYVGYTYNIFTSSHSSILTKCDRDGSVLWTTEPAKWSDLTTSGSIRVGAISGTNGFVITYINPGMAYFRMVLSMFDVTGATTSLASWTEFNSSSLAYTSSHPVRNGLGEIFNIEPSLTERTAAGTLVWSKLTGYHWTVGEDAWNGVHLASNGGQLSRCDHDGNQVWEMDLPSACDYMVLDPHGNRFIGLVDGSIARLGGESLIAPVITNAPQPQTILAGSNAALTVGAYGTAPLRYYWLKDGANVPGETNASLVIPNATASQAGSYEVVVSNHVDHVKTAPVALRVKSVAICSGDQLLTNGTYLFSTPPTLTIRSAYTNGSAFYTLDGSTPSFNSTHYTGPFVLAQSATVRAIGYSADFSQSDEADTVNANVLVNHTLSVSTTSGGTVTLNPPGGTYLATNIVTATAQPGAGWYFLYWLGDASGPNPSVNVSMERDKALHAVFGTTLSTTVTGNGSIQVAPAGGVYPLGTTLRLTAIPQPGNYFGFWGNAATGNTNPLYFTISGPNQTVSSIFAPLPADQAALTVLINGQGRVNANPRANAYSTNQSVTLTAVPDSGQSFLSWSGDASGTQNPLTVSMAQSRVITANFSSQPRLRVDRPGVEGLTPAGFRFTVVSDPQSAHEIRASTNLSAWVGLGRVTNDFGEVQFTDTNAAGSSRRFYQAAP